MPPGGVAVPAAALLAFLTLFPSPVGARDRCGIASPCLGDVRAALLALGQPGARGEFD
jgi:hypothetical protein